ncbi:hypothetical protein BS78_01G508200 [Paspalum vaginatum]|nr:hypothetical protein BS78_01G508200 [Paspalum vaginatum]
MCRATTMQEDGSHAAGFLRPTPRLHIRAFYLRLSSSPSPAPAELTLVYLPAIGGAALGLNGRALPPAAPAEVRLRRVAVDGDSAAAAYASADRVAAADGARFEVYAGKEAAAEGAFARRRGEGWRVECRRAGHVAAPVAVAEVVVLAEGAALMRGRARAPARGARCGATRLEGIPEEATDVGWGCHCECGGCGDDAWEVVGDESSSEDDGEAWKEEEMETVRWAVEMGAWAVCLGVGLLATARRFRRKRAFW